MLLRCPVYQETRQNLLDNLKARNVDLGQSSYAEILCFILSNKDDHIVKQSTKFCSDVLNTWYIFYLRR